MGIHTVSCLSSFETRNGTSYFLVSYVLIFGTGRKASCKIRN